MKHEPFKFGKTGQYCQGALHIIQKLKKHYNSTSL
nr:MAG TPA: gamma Interferon gamma [Bacteriophage sp.]